MKHKTSSGLFLVLFSLAVSFVGFAQANDLIVDGLNMGQTSCRDAIHAVSANSKLSHAQMPMADKDRDRQTKLMRTLLKKPSSDRSSLNELYNEYAAQTEKQELAKLAQWSPEADTKGFSCTLPGFAELGPSFATAFDLIQPGSLSLENMRIKECPYKRFFSATGVQADASQSPLACFEGKASFYAKQMRADYAKLKKEIIQKYGQPQELAPKMSLTSLSSANQNVQLNTLFKTGTNYVLLVNLAENASGKPALDASEIAPKYLKPSPVSEVYYFTARLYEANQKNKLTYLTLERRQLELVQKHDMASDEKPHRIK